MGEKRFGESQGDDERKEGGLTAQRAKMYGINWIYNPILKIIACQVLSNKKRRGKALSSKFDFQILIRIRSSAMIVAFVVVSAKNDFTSSSLSLSENGGYRWVSTNFLGRAMEAIAPHWPAFK